jgi:hypothetical protein
VLTSVYRRLGPRSYHGLPRKLGATHVISVVGLAGPGDYGGTAVPCVESI